MEDFASRWAVQLFYTHLVTIHPPNSLIFGFFLKQNTLAAVSAVPLSPVSRCCPLLVLLPALLSLTCHPGVLLTKQFSGLARSLFRPGSSWVCVSCVAAPWGSFASSLWGLCPGLVQVCVLLVRVVGPLIATLSRPYPLLGHAVFPFSTTLSGYVFVWL